MVQECDIKIAASDAVFGLPEATAMAVRLCQVAPPAARSSKQLLHKSRWGVTIRNVTESLVSPAIQERRCYGGNECFLREEEASLERKVRFY